MFKLRWFTITTITATLGMLGGCESARYTEAFYPEGVIDRVVIQSDSGLVEIISGNRVRVERTIRAPEGALDLSHQIRTGDSGEEVLYLSASCKPLLPCAVDMNLTLPAGIPVEVQLDEGEVWATGIGALSVQLSRGNLDADIAGPLQAQIGSGNAEVDLPARASATIAVGRGDISLSVPSGAWDLVTAGAQVEIHDTIEVAPSAAGSLELVAPAGVVRVSPAPTVADAR